MATLLPNDQVKKIPNTPSPPLTGTIGAPAMNKAPVNSGGAAKAIAKPPATGTIGVPASLSTTKTQAPAASPFDQFGGRDAYIKSQTERYNQAGGDQGLMSKLQADAKRVGYTLPTAQDSGVPIGYEWLGAGFENEVDSQLAGFNQQQEAARLAADYQIGQNNQYLQDQIAAMQQQRAVDQDSLQQQQNRFGGLYSGGLNYQGGQINSAYASQQGQLSRDIAGRNAQLLAQYGTQANEIANNIAQLQASRPEIINEKIRTYMDQQAQIYGTNPITNQQTAAYEGQRFGQDLSNKQYDRGVLESDRAFEYTQGRDEVADAQWESEFNRIKEQDGIQNALDWASHNLNVRQENRVASNQASGGSGRSGGSSGYKPSTEAVIQDINLPRTAASMETYIINNLPGGKKVAGPPSPNQQLLIEGMILDNPNLSEADIVKLYKKFGIPEPE